MKWSFVIPLIVFAGCNKSATIELPAYDTQLVVEMYLEEHSPLRCLLTESLPYSSTIINQPAGKATVVFYDGERADTLRPSEAYDYESGRRYNYASQRRFIADSSTTYRLEITDSINRIITASAKMPAVGVAIDSVVFVPSASNNGKYSVGLSFADPAAYDNYYRIVIGKGVNNYTASHSDFHMADVAFNGKNYSFYSEAGYEKNDTVTVRLYSLLPEHYNYIQSAESARTANYNPFMQPVRIKSNVNGGIGIFAVVRYDEKRVIIR